MFPTELSFLNTILSDDKLNELMFNGHETVYIERSGKLQAIPSPFKTPQDFDKALSVIIRLPNTVCTSRLQYDGMLPDGSRFHVTQPPQSPHYPTLTIRKFVPMSRGLDTLLTNGTLSKKGADFLEACVRARLNILISGAAGAGKTTLLNALSSKIDTGERVITIEDIPEIQIQHQNWVRMVAVQDGGTLRDCLIGALRMRPDRIIVGECRSIEALEMLQAMNTGHDGGMTTLHANSTRDTLTRLESLILFHAGVDIALRSLRRQIVDALHLIVHLKKDLNGGRVVEEILGLESMEGDIITRSTLFKRESANNNKLVSTGIVPKFIDRFKDRGITLPQYFFDPMAYED